MLAATFAPRDILGAGASAAKWDDAYENASADCSESDQFPACSENTSAAPLSPRVTAKISHRPNARLNNQLRPCPLKISRLCANGTVIALRGWRKRSEASPDFLHQEPVLHALPPRYARGGAGMRVPVSSRATISRTLNEDPIKRDSHHGTLCRGALRTVLIYPHIARRLRPVHNKPAIIGGRSIWVNGPLTHR